MDVLLALGCTLVVSSPSLLALSNRAVFLCRSALSHVSEGEGVRAGLMYSAGTRKLCFKVFLFEIVLKQVGLISCLIPWCWKLGGSWVGTGGDVQLLVALVWFAFGLDV